MSWNEPEDDAKKKDPWSGKGRRGSNQAPPDLDEVVKNISNRLNKVFSGGSGGSQGSSQGGNGFSGGLLAGFLVVAAVIWGFSGFYIVDEA